MRSASGLAFAVLVALVACGSNADNSGFDPTSGDSGGGGGGGKDSGGGGSSDSGSGGGDDTGSLGDLPDSGGADAATCGHDFIATIRDFKPKNQPDGTGHPDFEAYTGSAAFLGLVQNDLGADTKPVYAPAGATSVTTGKAQFDQWYNDVAGVNIAIPVTLTLVETSPGSNVYNYTNEAFFPIDGLGWGNSPPGDGGDHNFAFTTEVHLTFNYGGGEVFTFKGDDDLWVFINHKLAIDLGGPHPELTASTNLDNDSGKLGITKGNDYPLEIFHAERHRDQSHFNVTTTIKCFAPVTPK